MPNDAAPSQTSVADVARVRAANLLTPQQATQKQCRALGAPVQHIAVAGVSPIQFTFPNCAGPACMHWRWREVPPKAEMTEAYIGRGLCGLAGAHP